MRACVLVLGPLLARYGRAKVSLPGGCAIGARPIDQHLKGLEALGATIELEHGYVIADVPGGRLRGAEIVFDMPTVTGTENLMMAAALAKGRTTLVNARASPRSRSSVACSTRWARASKARAPPRSPSRVATSSRPSITRSSPTASRPARSWSRPRPTGGDVLLDGAPLEHLEAVIVKMRQAGVEIEREGDAACACAARHRFAPSTSRPRRIPGFPTDMQAQFMALMCLAEGRSVLTETIFENRFMHVPRAQPHGRAHRGRRQHRDRARWSRDLQGASVMATDLRASASLVIAGLVAEGETRVRASITSIAATSTSSTSSPGSAPT